MNDQMILGRLRTFFLGFSGFMCLGMIVELALAGHTKEPIQWAPFVLCAIGALVILVALAWPQPLTLRTLQLVMLLLMAGSLLGIYEHLAANLAFAQEIHPNAERIALVRATLTGGNPLLAPGTLAIAATTALAATYYHPAARTA